jgi:meso-butanediol dehydrogenase/(S,S)-butanediol dehydrogenase/diacetyl reductase
MGRFEGKDVLVTGAGGGIGRAIAVAFAAQGARLTVSDIVQQALEETAATIRNVGEQPVVIRTDITNNQEVQTMVDVALESNGKIDILCNSAGILTVANVLDMPESDWDRVLDVNLKGVFLTSKNVGRHMAERKSGSIINIASIAGKEATPSLAHYSASKFGVVALTQAMAKELACYGIRVNAICPGIVATRMMNRLAEDWQKDYDDVVTSAVLLGRDQPASDIADAAMFLVSNESITGQSINVCGGMVFH